MNINYKKYGFFNKYLTDEDLNNIFKKVGNEKATTVALKYLKNQVCTSIDLSQTICKILSEHAVKHPLNFWNRLDSKAFGALLTIQMYLAQKISSINNINICEWVNPNYQSLWNNEQFVIAAVEFDGNNLGHASKELQGNVVVVLKALEKNGSVLKYATDKMKNDKEVVITAVSQDGLAIRFASQMMKADGEVVVKAIEQNGRSIEHISFDLRKDKNLVLAAVKQNVRSIESAPREIYSDREIMREVGYRKIDLLRLAPRELRSDREFMMKFISQDPLSFDYVCGGPEKDEYMLNLVVARIEKRCFFDLPSYIPKNPSKLDHLIWADLGNRLREIVQIKINLLGALNNINFHFN